ncbi:MAG: hypothetical protein KA354_10680 [Phycisphaerae bacterium]|nr:hypothetical protein [Phycisphaerae bacterium]
MSTQASRVLRHMVVFGLACPGPALLAKEAMLAPEQFALLAWNRSSGDRATFEEMRECGFNLAGFVQPDQLDEVAAAGLKAIVHDSGVPVVLDATLTEADVKKRAGELADKVAAHPAVFGFYLADEPNARSFAALARWAAAFNAISPGKISYVNLFPTYANADQLGVGSYVRYLETFINTVKLPYISYDHYALMEDGSLRDGYFQNLEIVREAALRHKIPFWNVVMSTGCLDFAEPSDAGLRFQAYTTLAYGGRGISWFTYFSAPVGNFRLAPIDHFGQKTATWSMLRRVNMEVHRLGPTYLALKHVNVFHHPDVPKECRGIDTAVHLGGLSGGSFVVGEFVGPEDRPYVLVVNKSLKRSVCFSLKFKAGGAITQINAQTGQPQPFAGEQGWLAPGQGMLLTIRSAATSRPAVTGAGAKADGATAPRTVK